LPDADRDYAISVRRSCHGFDVLDGFHPSDSCRQRPLAFHPRDGHLARHRPVAGVLLDALVLDIIFFRKSDFRF